MKKNIRLILFFASAIIFSASAHAVYDNNYSTSFKGKNAYLTLPQITGDMDLHAPITVEFWMKPKAYLCTRKILTDVNGKTVAGILNKTNEEAGMHKIHFNTGNLLPGVYFCKIETNDQVQSVKMFRQ